MKLSKQGNMWLASGHYDGKKIHAIGSTRAKAWSSLIDVLAGVWV